MCPNHFNNTGSLSVIEILAKTEVGNVSLVGQDPLLTTIHISWFVIRIIILPLNTHIGMYVINFSMIFILVYDSNKWDNPWMGKITKNGNGDWYNIMIIYTSNVYMKVQVFIDDSKIATRNSPINTLVNQWLEMFEIVVGHIYGWRVNLAMYLTINSELLQFLCRIWIGNKEYFPYIHHR